MLVSRTWKEVWWMRTTTVQTECSSICLTGPRGDNRRTPDCAAEGDDFLFAIAFMFLQQFTVAEKEEHGRQSVWAARGGCLLAPAPGVGRPANEALGGLRRD
ncbi:hypothetical protein GUJ93_ZPchr0006g44658 [Zizania palustris]|uniref:Uncharacterized protein n=1 Tax=Zizania palustris TaxID=103762 RepID=A0A8J5T006_ZIZPA|nr:hypothetical protein GUJ93_ZPchr0006g44658 [Zizania palustris]